MNLYLLILNNLIVLNLLFLGMNHLLFNYNSMNNLG